MPILLSNISDNECENRVRMRDSECVWVSMRKWELEKVHISICAYDPANIYEGFLLLTVVVQYFLHIGLARIGLPLGDPSGTHQWGTFPNAEVHHKCTYLVQVKKYQSYVDIKTLSFAQDDNNLIADSFPCSCKSFCVSMSNTVSQGGI